MRLIKLAFVVILAQALQDQEIRGPAGQEQLGDDFIGAAQVDQLDLREVQQRSQTVGICQGCLDPGAHRGPRGAGDEVPIGGCDSLPQNVSHPDRPDHRDFGSCAGMMICTWAPGNEGRWSLSGMSSSHGGTIDSRAVPLRMEIFPSH